MQTVSFRGIIPNEKNISNVLLDHVKSQARNLTVYMSLGNIYKLPNINNKIIYFFYMYRNFIHALIIKTIKNPLNKDETY